MKGIGLFKKISFFFLLFCFQNLFSAKQESMDSHKIKNLYFSPSSQTFFSKRKLQSSYFNSSIFTEKPNLITTKDLFRTTIDKQITTLDGVTLLLTCADFLGLLHYGHLFQHLWAVWLGLKPHDPNKVKTIILALRKENEWTGLNEFKPIHINLAPYCSEDNFCIQYINAIFPNAQIVEWDTFVNNHQNDELVKFNTLFISDFNSIVEKMYAYHRNVKEFVEQMKLKNAKNLNHLMDSYSKQILKNLKIPPREDHKYHITLNYRDPQHTERCGSRLSEETQNKLIEALSLIPNTKLTVLDGTKTSLKKQIEISSHTDLMIGTKGWENSHFIFLPKQSSYLFIATTSHFDLLEQKLSQLCEINFDVYLEETQTIASKETLEKIERKDTCYRVIEKVDIPQIVDYVTKKMEEKENNI